MSDKEKKKFEEKYRQITISGGFAEGHDLVGYCHYYGHKGYLLRKHMKEHKCLERDCKHFEKNEDSQYFSSADFTKRVRKVGQKLKKLWVKGLMTSSEYIDVNNDLQRVHSVKSLDDFLDRQVRITVDIDTLMNLDLGNIENKEI